MYYYIGDMMKRGDIEKEYEEVMELGKDVLIANFYDIEDLEGVLGENISEKKYRAIVRQWNNEGWWDAVNEIIRQWYAEYKEDIEKEEIK